MWSCLFCAKPLSQCWNIAHLFLKNKLILFGVHTFLFNNMYLKMSSPHDGVTKWKHFSRYWPFVRGIHRSPVNSFHKGQWRGALMFALICVWINDWENIHEAGDLRRYRAHYDVIVMRNAGHFVSPSSEIWIRIQQFKKSENGFCETPAILSRSCKQHRVISVWVISRVKSTLSKW